MPETEILDTETRAQLQAYLEKVVQPIELVASLDDGDKSRELDALLQAIAGMSAHIAYRRDDDADARKPSFAIVREGTDIDVRFAGIPLGHEFTSLVLALLWVGGHPPKIDDALAAQVRAIEGTFRFETFMSLSCQSCPDTIQALNLMGVLNPNIRHVAIDGALFRDEVEAREVMSVPTVLLDGKAFGTGRMTVEEILSRIDTGAATRQAEALAGKAPFDVLVVGGGPAGASAAIYAARKGIRTGVVAERFGGQVLDTMGIENFASVPYTEGPKLAAQLESHVRDHDVDVMQLQRASKLLPAGRDGFVSIELEGGATLRARSIVLATGARWRELGVPGEADYRNRGVAYCPHCDGPLFKGKRVAVIGGGNSGVEAAIDLAGIVAHVTLVEFDDALRADEVLQRKLRSLPNVEVVTGGQTTEVLGNGQKVEGIRVRDRKGGGERTIALEGVFVQIGLLPNTEWLRGAIDLSPRGEIVIDDRGATSMPGVFAAGDATTVPYKQIVIAMGAGSTAALSAFDHLIRTSAPAEAAVAEAA
ncbi:alkyl hydroperoxide reductase subunit F [Luteimonas pelagia]